MAYIEDSWSSDVADELEWYEEGRKESGRAAGIYRQCQGRTVRPVIPLAGFTISGVFSCATSASLITVSPPSEARIVFFQAKATLATCVLKFVNQ